MNNIYRHKLYQEFQNQFPIEKLQDLSLDEYTNLEKDNSFCYWLESKTVDLGSFWGGSSYKFGIYRYNKKPNANDPRIISDEEYAWYSKYGTHNREKAFKIVKDAIVKVAIAARNENYDIIDEISELGNSYKWKIAFLYSDKKLVPFYKRSMLLSLAEKLGQIFKKSTPTSVLQKFILSKRNGWDIFDFTDELCKLLGLTKVDNITPDFDDIDFEGVRYWVYAPGDDASEWERCLSTSTMCLGWDKLGDYNKFHNRKEIANKLKEVYGKKDSSYKNDSLAIWNFLNVIRPGDIIIAKKGVGKILGRGVVEGDYLFDDSQQRYLNIRKVNWINSGDWTAPKQLPQKTLTDVTRYTDLIENINSLFEGTVKQNEPHYWWLVANTKYWGFSNIAVGESEAYTLQSDKGYPRRHQINFENAREGDIVIGYEANPIKKIVALLKVSKESDGENIRFEKTEDLSSPVSWFDFKDLLELQEMEFIKNPYGSFFKLTREEYEKLMSLIRKDNPNLEEGNPFVNGHKSSIAYTSEDFLKEVYISEPELNELINLLRQKKNIILQGAPGVGKTFTAKRLAYVIMGQKDDSRIDMIQFHQNFSYEDFIMGYKPTDSGGFQLIEGNFIEFCKKAKNDPQNDYFFIIDEINRGNLSKIFGELLMLIEKGYRDRPIKLAYNKHEFAVPSNLYLIGMMNTADRSLAMIDYALRRRFAFYPMKPGLENENFRKDISKSSDERVCEILEAVCKLNHVISEDDSLGDGFCIGHSYFCDPTDDDHWIENIVKYEICPMLDEYWFDNKDKAEAEKKKLLDLLK